MDVANLSETHSLLWPSWLRRRAYNAEIVGSSPTRTIYLRRIAQSEERPPNKREVVGSSPTMSIKIIPHGLMAMIVGFHPADRGSIPREEVILRSHSSVG